MLVGRKLWSGQDQKEDDGARRGEVQVEVEFEFEMEVEVWGKGHRKDKHQPPLLLLLLLSSLATWRLIMAANKRDWSNLDAEAGIQSDQLPIHKRHSASARYCVLQPSFQTRIAAKATRIARLDLCESMPAGAPAIASAATSLRCLETFPTEETVHNLQGNTRISEAACASCSRTRHTRVRVGETSSRQGCTKDKDHG